MSLSKTTAFGFLLAVALGCLAACQHAAKVTPVAVNRIEVIEFQDLPKLDGSEISLGGFSGLTLLSNEQGVWTFMTHTDRGPNHEPLPLAGSTKKLRRPFLLPEFQPRWVTFLYDTSTKTLKLGEETRLTVNNRKLTGLPNKFDGEKWDELPVDVKNKALRYDLMGLDAEGIARAEDGTYWMADEYRPSLVHFSADGKLLKRFVPKGSPKGTGIETLPERYLKRRANGGFEGVAYRDGVVYGFLQSSLAGEDGQTHILAVDAKTGTVKADYLYQFEKAPEGWPVVTKIGDGASLPDGSFVLIEQNSEAGEKAIHSVYRIRLGKDGELVAKELVADLVALGLKKYGKVEGLTMIDGQTLAILTDNDFGVNDDGKSAFVILHLTKPLFE